jgi:hypothetical protein
MRLIVMNIPEQTDALAGWLERQLVGLDLAELVAELEAIHAAGATLSLDDVLGGRRADVLQRGLGAVPAEALRQLLRQPRLLLELQELVLEHGGSHWGGVDAGAEMELAMHRGEQRLLVAVRGRRPAAPPAPVVRPTEAVTAWYRRPSVVSLATAAALLLAVGGYWFWLGRTSQTTVPGPTATERWGWNKPGALPNDKPAPEYLNALAGAGAEWFKKQPDDAPGVAQRINEFRQGCSTLILAPHKPLGDEDRKWLVERCRVWAKKLDDQLAALEQGEDPVKVRTEVDGIVNKLVDALHDRAKTAAGA